MSSLVDPSFENYQLTSGYEDFCCFYYWLCPHGEYIRDTCNCEQQCFEPLINFTRISFEEFRRYFVSFNVFYPSLSYTSFKTEPAMTFAGLLANLGGSLGLIVSMSVFTVFEVMELFFLIMHVLLFK